MSAILITFIVYMISDEASIIETDSLEFLQNIANKRYYLFPGY